MSDVKILIAGNSTFGTAKKGDVVEVIGSQSDWGSRTITPDWIRLVITDVSGSQQNSEDRLREYLGNWGEPFEYSKVAGAPTNRQRYRIGIISEFVDHFDFGTKLEIRDRILEVFDGVLTGQSQSHMEFETDVLDHPLDELANVISWMTFRRFCFSEALVDFVLASASFGEPVEYYRTFTWAKDNIIDKLKN